MAVTVSINEDNFYTELAAQIKNRLETEGITLPQLNSSIVWSNKEYYIGGRYYDYQDTVRQRLIALECKFSNVSVTASSSGINISCTVSYTPKTKLESPRLYQQ